MLNFLKLIVSICCLSIINLSFSQGDLNTLEERFSLDAQYKINKRWKSKVGLDYRSLGFQSYSSFIFGGGIKYDLPKIDLDLGTSYRFQQKIGYNEQRVELTAGWDTKIVKRTKLDLGLSEQFNWGGDEFEFVLRPKIEIEHKIKGRKIYPSTSLEGFETHKMNSRFIEKYRWQLGVGFEAFEDHSFYIGYLRDVTGLYSTLNSTNAIQLAYKIDL